MWLDDLAQHITDNSLGTPEQTLWIGPIPDNAAVQEPTTGLMIQPGNVYWTGKSGTAYKQPTLQVGTRAALWDVAWTRAEALFDLLNAITNETIGSTYFLRVAAQGTIEDYRRDEKDRQQFVTSFEVNFE